MTLEELNEKLDKLMAAHGDMSLEIDSLRVEILRLKVKTNQSTKQVSKENPSEAAPDKSTAEMEPSRSTLTRNDQAETYPYDEQSSLLERGKQAISSTIDSLTNTEGPKKTKFDLEKLIGENLINKVGILILIIGVAIGGKYSIDNNLINPLTRIILGYATGVALLITGLKLKEKYTNYSAVLVSGAMAIFYFITFFAYNFYGLMSQYVAFGLMVIFTIFTVLAALNYNKQVIAHLGLVGAVGVPFLLSNDSGNSTFLFSYLLLINFGIFYISLFKKWTMLFYSGFFLTWMVYLVWITIDYNKKTDFFVAGGFLLAYFLLFYAVFVAYKLKNVEQYRFGDIAILLINAALFYALGYFIIDGQDFDFPWLSIFTVGNAVIHFSVAKLIQNKRSSDTNLFYLIIGLVLVFLTVAIPVQLDGSWVTIMWMAMSALLFWIGRTKNVPFYEYISYALIAIACVSLLEDWDSGYRIAYQGGKSTPLPIVLNTTFLASCVSLLSLGFINWTAYKNSFSKDLEINPEVLKFSRGALPVLFLGILYMMFYNEIQYYFNQSIEDSVRSIDGEDPDGFGNMKNRSLSSVRDVWLILYSMIFISGVLVFASKKIVSKSINLVVLGAGLLVLLTFLTEGLLAISDLRKTYIDQVNGAYYDIGLYYIWIRYIGIGVCIGLCTIIYQLSKKYVDHSMYVYLKDIVLALIALWLLSSELIHWLDFSSSRNEYGLGISILWGVFSAAIIAIGIWKKKKHLRILGIVLFGCTLIKLFFYDLANLSTISKTVVLVALGILLLATSFLYNKYTIDDRLDE